MTWQAVDSLHFTMATGTGPQSIPERAGPERAGLEVITASALPFSTPAPGTARNIEAVRAALFGWGVTVVVVPDPAVLVPRYDRTRSTAEGLAFFTVALGRPPQFRDDAWVWTAVKSSPRPLAVSAPAFARCITEPLVRHGSRQAVPNCLVAASRRP
jgi:hypothetical protein